MEAMKNSGIITICVVAVSAVVTLAIFDPATAGFFPPCLFHQCTGLYCPGCGTTRALHQLLHGNLGAVLRLNSLTLLLAPVLGILAVSGRPNTWRPSVVWTLVIVVVAFGVLRNVPLYPFTMLVP